MKKFILHINLLILALLLTACQDSDEQLIRSQQGTLQVIDSNGVVRVF
ncbi:MAG: hypothetical protein GY787_14130 [Alteromonadales bacterium]|nr:hypothetical protein [Alteromonadales bacterium]